MDYENWITSEETVDDLQLRGLMIIQKRDSFRFGIDAVLLSVFAGAKKKDRMIDLGTGTGIIPILIAGRTEAENIIGLEIQAEIAEMADRSVRMNKLNDRISIVKEDLKNASRIFGKDNFDLVISNPPYLKTGHGMNCFNETKAISRHEIMCVLKDVIKAGSELLKTGGRLALVHRPERLCDILCIMREFDIEPKEMCFVYPKLNRRPVLVLLKGIKGAKQGPIIKPPLCIYSGDGSYTTEIKEIYSGGCDNG